MTTYPMVRLAALERELVEGAALYNGMTSMSDAGAHLWFAHLARLEDRIATAPARSLEDVAVKLRLLRRLECTDGAELSMMASQELLDSAIAAVEELARG